MRSKCLLVIVGPTAVGKTELAIRLAEYYKTEIISADSRQIYRELEIGTAKPTAEELSQVRHHFINSKSVMEEYNAGSFGRDAREIIDGLFNNHDLVVMCGGSGLYIKAVVEGFDNLPEVSPGIRRKVIEEYRHHGLAWLQQEVASTDPHYYEIVDRQNPHRLMRAIEVFRSSGTVFSGFLHKEKVGLPFIVVKVGLERERKELYHRIDTRIDNMIASGLFPEAENLVTLRHRNALQTVGYQEVFEFLDGVCDREEATRLMKRNSRRYAKRQLTWFKKDEEIQWFHPDDWEGILTRTKKMLQ